MLSPFLLFFPILLFFLYYYDAFGVYPSISLRNNNTGEDLVGRGSMIKYHRSKDPFYNLLYQCSAYEIGVRSLSFTYPSARECPWRAVNLQRTWDLTPKKITRSPLLPHSRTFRQLVTDFLIIYSSCISDIHYLER